MAKAGIKTPNKRKSVGNDTPAKKPKIENGKSSEKTPKQQLQTPKNNQQASVQKSNKKNKLSPNVDSGSPKTIKPFAGTKQLGNKKQNKQKPTNIQGDNKSTEKKKKRKNQYNKLISDVKAKSGSKDPELLKLLNEKINAIQSRPELTKTAKRKLAVLRKLKVISEEGAEAAAAKAKSERAASAKGNTDKKTTKQGTQAVKKEVVAKAAAAKVKKEEVDDEDSDEEEESDNEESGEEEEDKSGEEEEDSDAEAEEENAGDSDEDEDEDDDDDDDSDEEVSAPQEKLPSKKAKTQTESNPETQRKKPTLQNKKQIDLDELKTNNIVNKGQKRFVVFVGNIPYDTTREDLKTHFSKAGEILHIRIPTDKNSNRPRGFGYVEVKDEITYQKCLSMHHSQIKGRRINVLYTQGGKKKGEDKKKEIKIKNMKLHGLRTQGKLAGSVKQSQKRSFRRNKSKEAQKKHED